MATLIQIRRDTQANWIANNPVLALGEMAYSTDVSKLKVGNGSSAWNSLSYINALPSEISNLETDDISEGTTNLYFTNQRALDAVAGGTFTTDVVEEGTLNLYFTDQRAVDAVIDGSVDTDDIEEGTLNLYFTDQRAIDAVAGGTFTTDVVEEGTLNLYFTDQRAVDAVIDGSVDTDDIEEGTLNLYFTDQRAIDAVSESISIDDLSDVATSGVADGDALVYNTSTTSWVPGSVAIDSLNDINDVNITTPVNGEVLVYDNGDWVNQEASGGGIKDIRTSTTGFTFAIEDAGDLIQVNSSSETTIIIPTNVSVAIPVKTQVSVVRAGTGNVVLEASVGVTANATPGLKLRDQWSVATAIKTGTDEWLITGDLSE